MGGGRRRKGGEYLDYDLMPSPTGCVSSGSGASLSALSGLSGGGRREGGERGVGGGEIGWWGGAGRGEQGGGKREGGRGGGGMKRLQEWHVRPEAVDRCRLTPFTLDRR